jgi:phosphate transport system protein
MERVQSHFQDQLDLLSEKVLRMAGLAEESIGGSVDALVNRDTELAKHVIQQDAQVDLLELEIDQLCMETLALQQPMARDLRPITTAMKITTDLERIGDLAVNTSERAVDSIASPSSSPTSTSRSWPGGPIYMTEAQVVKHPGLVARLERDKGE